LIHFIQSTPNHKRKRPFKIFWGPFFVKAPLQTFEQLEHWVDDRINLRRGSISEETFEVIIFGQEGIM